jgi:hypothetical protein
MTIQSWVRRHRKQIDEEIRKACPQARRINDDQRARWVLSDPAMMFVLLLHGVRS